MLMSCLHYMLRFCHILKLEVSYPRHTDFSCFLKKKKKETNKECNQENTADFVPVQRVCSAK